MLEIAFDEHGNDLFLGEKYPVCDVGEKTADSWDEWRKIAAEFLSVYAQERVFIIRGMKTRKMCWLALALSVEAYGENNSLETVVFKVSSSQEALSEYRPFVAMTNAVRYVRDLLRLENEKEIWADMNRLGYLGIVSRQDYVNGGLSLCYDGGGTKKIQLAANGKNAALVLVGIMKNKAICKEEVLIEGFINKKDLPQEIYLPTPKDEDDIIRMIIDYSKGM